MEQTIPGEPVAPPAEPTGDVANVETSFVILAKHMDAFIVEYERNMLNCRTENERLENIVDLCQKLERLHPLPDGNAHSFAILTLNHLLVRNGMPLTMLNAPTYSMGDRSNR
ncbi:hypothetical protein ACFQDN_22890 [Pseudomonas asuensis]